MPTYQYQCKQCGHEMEEFQSITEPPLTRCPACSTDRLVRVLGSGGGLIFKGTGFYLTDYKKSPPAAQTGSKGSSKSESPAGNKEVKQTDSFSSSTGSKSAGKKG